MKTSFNFKIFGKKKIIWLKKKLFRYSGGINFFYALAKKKKEKFVKFKKKLLKQVFIEKKWHTV